MIQEIREKSLPVHAIAANGAEIKLISITGSHQKGVRE